MSEEITQTYFCASVLAKFFGINACKVPNFRTFGSSQILVHAVIEGEKRRSSTNFSTK